MVEFELPRVIGDDTRARMPIDVDTTEAPRFLRFTLTGAWPTLEAHATYAYDWSTHNN